MPVNLNKLQEEEDEEVINNMELLAISKLEPGKHAPPRYVRPDISRWYPSKNSFPPIFIWDQVSSFSFIYVFPCFTYFYLSLFVKLRLARNLRYPTRSRPIFLQPLTKPFTRPWDLDFDLHRLRAVHSFKESPGCKSNEEFNQSFTLHFPFFLAINRVEQKGGWTVIASACTGGLPDTVNGELFFSPPYNI